jgi:hypothetical protein
MNQSIGADMFRWVKTDVPGAAEKFPDLLPGLRAAVDTEGTIWAWSGLLTDRAIAVLLAAADDEPFLIDGGNEYLRLSWMQQNLALDEAGTELATLLEARVRLALRLAMGRA